MQAVPFSFLISQKRESFANISSVTRTAPSLATLLLLVPVLMDCSPGTLPPIAHPLKTRVQCFSNIPHRSLLPAGAHVDCHGAPTDIYGRFLSYVGGSVPWRAIDHGVGIDPSVPAASPDDIEKAKRDASLHHVGSYTPGMYEVEDCIDTDVTRSRDSSPTDCGADNGFGNGELFSIEGIPHGRLLLAADGYYFDENGGEWWFEPTEERWYKTVVLIHAGSRRSQAPAKWSKRHLTPRR